MTGDLFHGGLLEALLYPLKPGVSRGPPGLSGGQAPSGPLVIRPLRTISYRGHVALEVSSPGSGTEPQPNRIWCILALKSDIWWQQLYRIIFMRIKQVIKLMKRSYNS